MIDGFNIGYLQVVAPLDDIATKYMRAVYSKKYNVNHLLLEPPRWIAALQYLFGMSENIIITDKVVDFDNIPYIVFVSLMNTNKHIVEEMVQNTITTFHIGGYCKLDHEYDNVRYIGNINNNYRYEYRSLYSKLNTCIPRITIQEGCTSKHQCSFCTVDKTVRRLNIEQVVAQIIDLNPLTYNYIYIDDKTFDEYSLSILDSISHILPREYIIQTTPKKFLELDTYELLDAGVRYVELGIETLNYEVLHNYTYKSNSSLVRQCIDKVSGTALKLIPNIILNLPGDDGVSTLNFVKSCKNMNVISHFNFTWYTDYSKGESEIAPNDISDTIKQIIQTAYEIL